VRVRTHAAVWGILAGVFNSIPYVGPVIVSGGLLLIGLVQSGDAMQAAKISAAALVITSLEGWLLTPPLLGKAERMHVVPWRAAVDVDLGRVGHDPRRTDARHRQGGRGPPGVAETTEPVDGTVTAACR
jgi:hypothetical protein